MKKYGNTNSEGLCTVKNPYLEYTPDWDSSYQSMHDRFAQQHPPLHLYTPSGQLVKDAENVEVEGPVWQTFYHDKWNNVRPTLYDTFEELQSWKGSKNTRQIYRLLTVPQTEMEGIDMSDVPTTPMKIWYKELGNRLLNTEPAPMSSKGIKSLEQKLRLMEKESFEGWSQDAINGYLTAVKTISAHHAQFATEAGGETSNELIPPELWLQQRSLSNSIISHPHAGDQYVECVSDAMRVYADFVVSISRQKEVQDIQSLSRSTAPSNNSSSEMVEVSDTHNCEKCGGRTALCTGNWSYEPDDEPYNSGVYEAAKVSEGDAWVAGYICDDCGHVQKLWNE